MELTRNMALFRRTKALENEIDEFLDKLSESALVFRQAIELYLTDGPGAGFDEKLRQVNELESRADQLRRGIETQLYAQTLIPESRGDVGAPRASRGVGDRCKRLNQSHFRRQRRLKCDGPSDSLLAPSGAQSHLLRAPRLSARCVGSLPPIGLASNNRMGEPIIPRNLEDPPP